MINKKIKQFSVTTKLETLNLKQKKHEQSSHYNGKHLRHASYAGCNRHIKTI